MREGWANRDYDLWLPLCTPISHPGRTEQLCEPSPVHNTLLKQGHLNNIIGPCEKQCTGTLPAQPLTEITM
jgi:hypothetical protein